MAKCFRCGKSLLFKKTFQLKDAVVCERCAEELTLFKYIPLDYYSYNDVKDGFNAYLQRKNENTTTTTTKTKAQAPYFFLVHDLDGEFVEKYRKENTDKEDLYEGMSFNDIRETCYEGDKIYKYPPMPVYPDFKETTRDGKPALEVYLDDHLIGYVPKTKVSKVKKLLSENASWSAELYGGDYQYLKGTYVDEWFDKVNIKVSFE